jgi:predicted aspartyl protease
MAHYPRNVSVFHVDAVARNLNDESRATPPIQVLVDTGAELSWFPADALRAIGITPRHRERFETATGQVVEREVGWAILTAEGFEAADHVVFAEPGDTHVLGVRTLEGFAVTVDPVGRRFIHRNLIIYARGRARQPSAAASQLRSVRRASA